MAENISLCWLHVSGQFKNFHHPNRLKITCLQSVILLRYASIKKSSAAAYYYLTIVPFLAVVIGFGVGRSSPWVYIPVWVVHTTFMLLLLRRISKGAANNTGLLLAPGIMMVVPWILFSIFAGFGPPPSTAEKWVALATEEQLRYMILVAGGVCVAAGLSILKQYLNQLPGKAYVTAAMALLNISMPLYVINMLYWGFFLTEAFKGFTTGTARPEWYMVTRQLFYWIDSIQLCLFYIVTALFAAALKKSKIFKPGPCNIYITISLLAAICSLLPGNLPTPLDVIAYFVAIPAIGFIMPYLMGLNIIRHNTRIINSIDS